MSDTRRRDIRDAVLDAAAAASQYEIVETIKLAKDEPKFSAWITGARGRNGFRIKDAAGNTYIVGLTTLRDLNDRGAVTNFDVWTTPAPAAAIIATMVPVFVAAE
jgi:hypothetical protein